MILYHGSNISIEKVELHRCRPYKDFGKGFYCTTIKNQAELMAKRVSTIFGGIPSVTQFDSMECNHDNKYDLVVGPIANDDLALLFRTFTNGFIDLDTLIKDMEYKKLSDQYSFHTDKALQYLNLVGGI